MGAFGEHRGVGTAQALWSAGFLALLGSGCLAFEDPLVEEPYRDACLPQAWMEDAAAFGDPGVATAIDLRGTQVRVIGEPSPFIEAIENARGVHLGDAFSAPLLVFEDAVVDGQARGTVVMSSKFVEARGGTFLELGVAPTTVDDTVVRVNSPPGELGGPRPSLGPGADPSHEGALAESTELTATIEDLEVIAADQVYAVTASGQEPLALPLTISAPRAYWTQGSQIVANSIRARYAGEVFIGLNATSGNLTAEGQTSGSMPYAVLGRDAHLVVGPDQVKTVDDLAVRQALSESAGALIPADMELRICQSDPMVFEPGEVRVLTLSFRERSGLADAIFAGLTVTEEDTGIEWAARIEVDPEIPMAFVAPAQEHPETTWSDVFVLTFDAWATAVIGFGEALGCIFTLGLACGDEEPPPPPPLVDLPGWATPGEMGTFEVELAAPGETGTYPIVFTLRGQNYQATASTTIVVQE